MDNVQGTGKELKFFQGIVHIGVKKFNYLIPVISLVFILQSHLIILSVK